MTGPPPDLAQVSMARWRCGGGRDAPSPIAPKVVTSNCMGASYEDARRVASRLFGIYCCLFCRFGWIPVIRAAEDVFDRVLPGFVVRQLMGPIGMFRSIRAGAGVLVFDIAGGLVVFIA